MDFNIKINKMKVFKVKDYIESYYTVYNIVVANTKEEALKVIKKKSYDESYFTLEDIEEIPNIEYNVNCPKLILSMGENVKE